MKKHNFVRVITFISILILFFAQSVYESSVHARMKKIEDESLSDIDAAALNIDMMLTVRSVVQNGLSFRTNETATANSIDINYMEIADANLTTGSSFQTNTSMAWDLGYSGTQMWLMGGNVFFPVINPGMGVNMVGVSLKNNGGGLGAPYGNLPIGNVTMKGIIFGQNVLTGSPNLDPFVASAYTTPWIIISARSEAADRQGIKFFTEVSGYINEIALAWRPGQDVAAQGVYIYGMMNETTGFATPAGWSKRNGMMKMGGVYPTYNVTSGSPTGVTGTVYNTIDMGTSGTTVGGPNARFKATVNLPVAGSIRIKNVSFGTATWGPFCLDDVAFYTNRLTIREL